MAQQCKVVKPRDACNLFRGTNGFGDRKYFESVNLEAIARSILAGGEKLVASAFIAEIRDHDGPLHSEAGATIAFITAGSGYLKTESGDIQFAKGDVIIIPPRVPHRSVAVGDSIAIECGVYFSNAGDYQAVVSL